MRRKKEAKNGNRGRKEKKRKEERKSILGKTINDHDLKWRNDFFKVFLSWFVEIEEEEEERCEKFVLYGVVWWLVYYA